MKRNQQKTGTDPTMTKLRWTPQNRMERRVARRETERMLRLLLPIEMEFNKAVLMDNIDYTECYTLYLDKWQSVLSKIDQQCYVIVEPVRDYFARQFAPQEG